MNPLLLHVASCTSVPTVKQSHTGGVGASADEVFLRCSDRRHCQCEGSSYQVRTVSDGYIVYISWGVHGDRKPLHSLRRSSDKTFLFVKSRSP